MAHTHEKGHPYHLVNPSPWPILTAFAVLTTFIGLVLQIHQHGHATFYIGVIFVAGSLAGWFRDIIHEAVTEKQHTPEVRQGLRYGIMLFILSEVMFFVAFFWAFFNSSLFPAESIGHVWPPKDIHPIDPFRIPYLNTLILLLSATSVTWAHDAISRAGPEARKEVIQGLWITVALALSFTGIQVFEYIHATFVMKDNIYGSNFYMLTGFHGAHVIIGTIFLSVCLGREYLNHFTPHHHVGFEAAAWYWHFVDVVWLFLFVFIYWMGS